MRIPKRWISLCLVILLLAGVVFGHGSLMADQAEAAEPETTETASVITEEGAGVPAVQSEINQPQTTPESQPQTTPESQPQTGTSVTVPQTETPVTVPQTETPATEPQTEESTPETTPDTSVPAESESESVPAQTNAPESEDTQTPETAAPESTETETSESAETETETQESETQTQEPVSEAAVLKQEFTDASGAVIRTVTADIPEGAFEARADQLSMEVKFLDADSEAYIVSMMEDLLPENYELGGYVLYQIDFKVDGVSVQPAKAITISMEGNDLTVKDTEDAHVFRYDPADPQVAGDKDQLEEIIQKAQLIRSLTESGTGTANIEDYTYSEIIVNNKNADSITLKGWESGIYGCYTQNAPVALEGSAEGYHVALTGPASSFPEDGELTLSVKEVSQKTDKIAEEAVEEEAEKEDLQVVNYTALDITILKDGKEIQPLGPVNVTFTKEEKEEKESSADTKPDQIKVFHVDEETGKAQDMEATEADEGQVAIETDHFSVYVVVDLDQLGGQIDLTVQHWAYMQVLDGVNGSDGLTGSGPDGSGPNNNTVATLSYKTEFTSIYSDDTVELFNIPKKIPVEDLSKVYATTEGENYKLKEVWVLKNYQENPGEIKDDSEATWMKYSFPGSGDETITLTKNSVIRFIYEPLETENALIQDATFYDWNVTDGPGIDIENGYYNWWAGKSFDVYYTDQGINNVHDKNNFNGGDDTNSLAVGLESNGVYHYKASAKIPGTDKLLNVYTQGTSGVKGIVTGVNENGPIYAQGVYDADLFNNEPHTGKHIANDYDLVFDRNGDTYTFTAVNKGKNPVLTDLETFWETYDDGEKNLFSNNFWPLDTIESYGGKDPLWGDYTQAGGSGARGEDLRAIVPRSDDGNAHNWFFGMRYDFEFTIGDYTGPLNFYFRGDDDFWLFIDGELVVDLGGIHSSIGELCSLEYLRAEGQDLNQKHKATIIYAERGGTGSTCYMEFTMPNVEPLEFEPEPTTSVSVEKIWNDHDNPTRPDSIEVELYYKEPSSAEWKLAETATLNIGNNWSYTWNKLPKEGYQYMVKEKGEENGKFGNYTVTYSPANENHLTQNSDGTWSGTITNTASPNTQINVTKIWDDGGNASGSRPDQAEFQLYYREHGTTEWTAYPNGKLTLDMDDKDSENPSHWKGTYEKLPVYSGETGTLLEYTVMEISNGQPVLEGGELPGKAVGIETYVYTTSYTVPENHFNVDGTWAGYEAVADGITLELTVTNSQGREIEVIKQWKGTLENKIPDSVYVGLYLNDNPVSDKYIQLKKDEGWKGSFKYLGEGTYTVKELRETTGSESAEFTINEKEYTGISSGNVIINDVAYDVTYPEGTTTNNKTTYTIVNQGSWQLIKRSSSETDGEPLMLPGAEFDLTHDGTTYKGVSGSDGIVTWKTTDGGDVIGPFPDGEYTLTETKAPTGYALGNSITFTMKDGVPGEMGSDTGTVVDGIITFYYDNTAIYALPSSGGSGIYKYLFGGVLLMMAASLIVYKNKRREVLEGK